MAENRPLEDVETAGPIAAATASLPDTPLAATDRTLIQKSNGSEPALGASAQEVSTEKIQPPVAESLIEKLETQVDTVITNEHPQKAKHKHDALTPMERQVRRVPSW